MNENTSPYVSVIIPTFNDAKALKKCLSALSIQTYNTSHFEVIVVDNGSKDFAETEETVASFQNVKLLTEKNPGSYAARNKGLEAAQGEIIAFTDSDCIPVSDWLEKGVNQLISTENCGQVVGQITLFFAKPDEPNLVEIYESLTSLNQEQLLKNFQGGATANVLTWKYVIDNVGGFNCHLKSAGDLEWGRRVHAAGYVQVYAADTIVQHPARQAFSELSKRSRRLSGGGYTLCIKPGDPFIERQKMFARLLLEEVLQSANFALTVSQNSKISNPRLKFQLIALNLYVRLISFTEKIRLKLGGNPTRS